jgi:multisite-specific tRNA:(cytosine-C5)-methyltransferase
MLPKEDRKAMLLRLYNDDSPLLDNSKDRFHNKQNGDASDVATDENMVVDEEQQEDSEAPDRLGKEDEDVTAENELEGNADPTER